MEGAFGLIYTVTMFLWFFGSMIAYLLKLKERCATCKDPEKEIVQKIWRLMLTVLFYFLILSLVDAKIFPS